jgi:predicted transcriptional regulator
MASMDDQILRTTKEIVVKFIEGGRISPAGFPDFFKNIYQTVHDTVKESNKCAESKQEIEKKK